MPFEKEINRSDQLLHIHCPKCKNAIATASHCTFERVDNGRKRYTSTISCLGVDCAYHSSVEFETSMVDAMEQAWRDFISGKREEQTSTRGV